MFPGVYPRWHVSFNITMLRLVSFNMDYFWACNRAGADYVSPLTFLNVGLRYSDIMWP
jgi:hypothetical protein